MCGREFPGGDLRSRAAVEWPTLAMLTGCYAVWFAALFVLPQVSLALSVAIAGIAIALHSSLTHEVVHGHPFRNQSINAALVFPALTLVIPYLRFKDTHLAHHEDSNLTDPYDDPESNFADPMRWHRFPGWLKSVLRFNNTLLGRVTVGPLIGQIAWVAGDIRAIFCGNRRVALGWALHIPAVVMTIWIVSLSSMPIWSYCFAAYFGLSLLKIRTFLEHRAHEKSRARTVVIDDKGPLAWLFLNNNLHAVHHRHPKIAWYELPKIYHASPDKYLSCNEHYSYNSYAEIFGRFFWRAKDPVPHPLWPSPENDAIEMHGPLDTNNLGRSLGANGTLRAAKEVERV